MKNFNELIAGKKTYLVVAVLMFLNVLTSDNPVDVSTLQETLTLGLVGTLRSALNKVGT